MKTTRFCLTVYALLVIFYLQLSCGQRAIANKLSSVRVEQQKSVCSVPQIKETPTKLTSKPHKDMPIIKVESPTYNFGKVGPGENYNCEFQFQNVGDDILKIERIASTCGCTIPKLNKKEYAPGESGLIEVKFRTPKCEGITTKHLYIYSNDKKKPKLELTIKARVELYVTADLKKLNLSLKEKNAGITPITVISKDGKPFSIKNFASSHNIITANFDPKIEGTKFVLKPKVNIKQLNKYLTGKIKISLTHPRSDHINITYAAKPLFEASCPMFFIRNAKPGRPVIKDIWVKSNYEDPFEIESISSLKQYIKVISQKQHKNSVKLELQVTPPGQINNSTYFRDMLKIKLKNGTKLTVRCNGWYDIKLFKQKKHKKTEINIHDFDSYLGHTYSQKHSKTSL